MLLAKGVTLVANRELIGLRRRAEGTARTIPELLDGPAVPAAREDGHLVIRGVRKNQPVCGAVVPLSLPNHLLLV